MKRIIYIALGFISFNGQAGFINKLEQFLDKKAAEIEKIGEQIEKIDQQIEQGAKKHSEKHPERLYNIKNCPDNCSCILGAICCPKKSLELFDLEKIETQSDRVDMIFKIKGAIESFKTHCDKSKCDVTIKAKDSSIHFEIKNGAENVNVKAEQTSGRSSQSAGHSIDLPEMIGNLESRQPEIDYNKESDKLTLKIPTVINDKKKINID